MSHTFQTDDGLELRTRTNEPKTAAHAKIILVHGIGDQVEGIPYKTAAEALAERGFQVHRLELRGHGESGGEKMYIDSWHDFRKDLGAFVQHVAAEPPPLLLFLVGISMGGLIVTNYAAHSPKGLAGVVAVAPALGDTGGSPALRAILPLLSRFTPRLRVDPGLDLKSLTRDAEMQKAYLDDPLYQAKITPRIAAELLETIQDTRKRAIFSFHYSRQRKFGQLCGIQHNGLPISNNHMLVFYIAGFTYEGDTALLCDRLRVAIKKWK